MTVFDQNIFSHYKYFTYSVIISLGLDPDPDWFRKISNRIDPDPYSAKYLDADSVNMDPKHLLIRCFSVVLTDHGSSYM